MVTVNWIINALAILGLLLTKIGRGCSCLRWVWVLRGHDPFSRFLQLRTRGSTPGQPLL